MNKRNARSIFCFLARPLALISLIWRTIPNLLTGEFLLTSLAPQRNSGGIIVLRSAYVALLAALSISLLSNAPYLYSHCCDPSPKAIGYPETFCGWLRVIGKPTWNTWQHNGALLVAAFAGTYTALYARFASQWQYLADLYNQIKSKEIDLASNKDCDIGRHREDAIKTISDNAINTCCNPAHLLAEWKIGFIEDANTLHLSDKPPFANVVQRWSSDDVVQAIQSRASA